MAAKLENEDPRTSRSAPSEPETDDSPSFSMDRDEPVLELEFEPGEDGRRIFDTPGTVHLYG